MAKSENDETSPWTTMEELLLACAVHRHGIDSWDTVATEIHKQNSSLRTLTPFDCRQKYYDLKRRFSGEETVEISSVPWLEELRKLRVDELRREVERYDLSISSLEMKVKRLEDEREKSLNSDLDKIVEMNHESVINSGVPVTELVNSPDPTENIDVKTVEPVDEEPNRIGGEDNDEKPDSCKGSCESVAKDSKGRHENDSPEFVESMDESKGEEEAKETSDVQSSASLPRKKTVELNQPVNENQSLTVNNNVIESQPLIDFIEILQSHPIGSHFSRLLETQGTHEYDKIIRQHIDFEMIRRRVEEGYYKISKSKFFRDLLLLINNLRVFYGESSSEFNAAKKLYQLIKKQMSLKNPKEESLVMSKEEVTVSSLKQTLSVPMIACRKRSSLAVRPSLLSSESLKKKIVPTLDEISDKDEEPIVSKKMTRGRTLSTGSRNVKSNKGGSSNDSVVLKKSVEDKKGNNTSGGSKKQSAASFLKRMKGVSVSETIVETVKADSSSGKRGAEQGKSNTKNDKVDVAKPLTGQKRLTGKKPTVEKCSSPKKNTRVVSKRGTALLSPLMAKQESEISEKETDSFARPKKRSRR